MLGRKKRELNPALLWCQSFKKKVQIYPDPSFQARGENVLPLIMFLAFNKTERRKEWGGGGAKLHYPPTDLLSAGWDFSLEINFCFCEVGGGDMWLELYL